MSKKHAIVLQTLSVHSHLSKRADKCRKKPDASWYLVCSVGVRVMVVKQQMPVTSAGLALDSKKHSIAS